MFEPSAAFGSSSHLSAVLDIIDKATKITAVFIGGGWVYLNYLRGRTFKHRLEPNIISRTVRSDGVLLLSGSAQIKNVGLSRVPIQQKGTAIEVLGYILNNANLAQPKVTLQNISVRSVFEAHGWIEPGEQIEESFLIAVPEAGGNVAFRLNLRIVSAGIEWNSDCVTEIPLPVPIAPEMPQYVVTLQKKEGDKRTIEIERRKRDPNA